MPYRLRTLLVLALAVTSGIVVMAARQAPAAPPQLRTSVIFGRVLDDATGRPVRDAVVTLGGLPTPPPPPAPIFAPPVPPPIALTDAAGQFVFRDLPSGQFTLSVVAAGYLGGGYGQRRPGGSTRQLALHDNETVNDADIRIWKSAAISGTVFDEAGPAVQITVLALRRDMVRGRLRLTPVSSGQSDDRGMYRIYGLSPGTYVISMPSTITSIPASVAEQGWGMDPADPNARRFNTEVNMTGTMGAAGGVAVGDQQVYTYYDRPLAPAPGNDDRFLIYPTVFAPSAVTPHEAGAITLASGDQREGVDLRIAMTESHRVSGTLSGPDGPAANVAVRLSPAFADELASDTGFVTSATATDARGHFTLVGVPPGDYTLRAMRAPLVGGGGPMVIRSVDGSMMMVNAAPAGPAPPGSDVTLSAEMPVAISDRDPAPLALTLQPGARLSGRVVFSGAATPPTPDQMTRVFLSLSRADGRSLNGGQSSPVDRTGTFKTAQVPPGRYMVSLGSSVSPWTLRSVIVDGHEAIDREVDLTHDLTDIVATFTDRLPDVSGTVRRTGATGEPDVKASIAIFPADYQAWIAGGMVSRNTRLVDAAPNGAFDARGLLPGDYLLAAFDLATTVDLQDPNDIAALARIGTRVTLGDADQKTVALTVARLR